MENFFLLLIFRGVVCLGWKDGRGVVRLGWGLFYICIPTALDRSHGGSPSPWGGESHAQVRRCFAKRETRQRSERAEKYSLRAEALVVSFMAGSGFSNVGGWRRGFAFTTMPRRPRSRWRVERTEGR